MSEIKVTRYQSKNSPHDRQIVNHYSKLKLLNKVYGVVILGEITVPWHTAKELLHNTVQTFQRELMASSSKSSVTRFEEALKAVNTVLSKAQNKVTADVNMAIVLICDGSVTFSYIGNIRMKLIRNGRVSDAITSSSQYPFNTITSGELGETDCLIIANKQAGSVINDHAEIITNSTDKSLEQLLTAPPEILNLMHCAVLSAEIQNESIVNWEKTEPKVPLTFPKIKLPGISKKIKLPSINFSTILSRFKISSLNPSAKISKFAVNPVKTGSNKSFKAAMIFVAFIVVAGVAVFSHRAINNYLSRNSADEQPKIETLNITLQKLAHDESLVRAYLSNTSAAKEYSVLSDEQRLQVSQILESFKIKVINPDRITSLGSKPIFASQSYNEFFIIDELRSVWTINNNILTKIELPSEITSPNSVVGFGDNLVISDDAGTLWLYNYKNQKIEPTATTESNPAAQAETPTDITNSTALYSRLANNFPSGKKIVNKYLNHLYILTENGAVYRRINFTDTLDGSTQYVRPRAEFASGSKLLINGDFIVTTETGTTELVRTATAFNKIAEAGTLVGIKENIVATLTNQILTFRNQEYYLPVEDKILFIQESNSGITLVTDSSVIEIKL